MKTERQAKILEIIENNDIETQDALIEFLTRSNFVVTQATVSRDIRELKLAKVLCANGVYKYVAQKEDVSDGLHLYNQALVGSMKYIDYALNNIVIKTYPGLASPVAAGIDALAEADILGCVAGDDTVIVVVRNAESAVEIARKLRALSKE